MKKLQALIISFVYFVFCFFGIQHHELWLDEAHHILLGRDSCSFQNLIHNCRYEGHPILWDAILYVVFHQVFYIQLFHIIISTSCVYIILKHAPFSTIVKLLLVFGYFMIYEYAIISRHYSLSVLFILLILVHLSSPKKNFIILSFLFFLLINVHIFSTFIVFAFLLILWNDWKKESFKIKAVSLLILLSGLALCLVCIIPPNDHFLYEYNHDGFLSLKRLAKTSWVPVKGMFPMPDITKINYWNSNAFINMHKGLGLLMSVIAFIVPGIIFLKNKKALILFYVPLIGVLLFFYLTPLMLTSRNCGYISILLLLVYWVKQIPPEIETDRLNFISDRLIKHISFYFVTGILIVQFFAGIVAYYFDITRDFSNSKKASQYINLIPRNDSTKILLSHHSSGPALSVYLNKPLFYLETEKAGSFCEWNTQPFINSDSIILRKIKRQLDNSSSAILILNEGTKAKELLKLNERLKIINGFKMNEMIAFTNATVNSENYFIYKLK